MGRVRIVLKLILKKKKEDDNVWIEFIWLRMGTNGRLL